MNATSGQNASQPISSDVSERTCTQADIDRIAGKLKTMWNGIEAFRRPPENGNVLVDLTVGNWLFVLTKLLISKYVAWHLKAGVVAVVPGRGGVTPFMGSFLDAFGVKTVVDLAGTIDTVHQQWPDMRRVLTDVIHGLPAEGKPLRDGLSGLRIRGVPLGDLIYDTYLRSQGAPTLEKIDQHLINLVGDAMFRQRAAETIFSQFNIKFLVSGHMVYNYFGIFSRTALASGIPVTQDISQNPIRLKHYRDFTTARQSTSQFQQREFDHVFRHDRAAAVAFGSRYIADRITGQRQLVVGDLARGAYGADRRRLSKGELCAELGWDAGKPIVALMSHVLFESPHTVGGALFNDIHEWLDETAALAAGMPDVQILIKPHPDQRHYDAQSVHSQAHVPGDEAIRRLVERRRAGGGLANVAFCPPDLHTGSLVDMVNAVVTQHGTAGYEMASCGVPVILIGKAPYSRLGFTIEPRTLDEYAATLKNAGTLPRLTEEQRERAMTFIYLLFEKGRSKTNLLPEYNLRGSWIGSEFPEILFGLEERIDSFDIDTEPLYHALDVMLRNGYSSLNIP